QLRKVPHKPCGAGKVLLSGSNEHRIHIHADHVVALPGEVAAVATRPAASVQDPRAARRHSIDEPGLTDQIRALGGQPPKPLDVPGGMIRVLGGDLHPLALLRSALLIRPALFSHSPIMPDGCDATSVG